MKRSLCFILALIFCFTLVACNKPSGDDQNTSEEETVTKAPPEIVDKVYDMSADIANFKTHGRVSLDNSGLICDASASGIEFNAYIEGELKVTVSVDKVCYFTLYVDGVRQKDRVKANAGESTLTLASFEEGEVHNIKFIKQTEAQCAICKIKTVGFLGYFEDRPENKEVLIEFIGDSITAGYGNLCANGAADPGSALNQDATQTYAYLTAEALDVDCSLVCYSGIGIAKGWPSFTMDKFFSADSYVRNSRKAFKASRVPDIVVINLGTNDNSKGSTFNDLLGKVPALIELVRSTYGTDVPIVWVHGMMGNGAWNSISRILASKLGGEAKGIYSLEISENRQGGGAHPSLKAHADASKLLAAFLKEKGLIGE